MNERFYLLKIQLLDIEPAIWRRFVVPASICAMLNFKKTNIIAIEVFIDYYNSQYLFFLTHPDILMTIGIIIFHGGGYGKATNLFKIR